MRVLIVHNRYRAAGGEDTVVAAEHRLLQARGHAVGLASVSNETLKGAGSILRAAWNAPYSWAGRRWMAARIEEFKPDVVHVHNFFPLLSPAIYDACQESKVAVVQTLHNYRTVCANGLLLRRGRPCEACITGAPYRSVLHGCYRGSRLASVPLARMINRHRRAGTWQSKVDRFIALTEFARSRFVAAGLPADKISVKPNFIDHPGPTKGSSAKREGAVFVGRLAAEKGIGTLVAAWRSLDIPLRLIGDGPERSAVECLEGSSIAWLGWLQPAQVAAALQQAHYLVMASEWYEGFPMVLVEAFAHGAVPIVPRLGAMAEVVEDGRTGLHFRPGDPDDLADKVRWAVAHPEQMRRMGAEARRVYEHRFTPEANYPRLIAIYQAARDAGKRHEAPAAASHRTKDLNMKAGAAKSAENPGISASEATTG